MEKRKTEGTGPLSLPSERVDEPLAEMQFPKSISVVYPWVSGAGHMVQAFLSEVWNQASKPLGVLIALAAFPLWCSDASA